MFVFAFEKANCSKSRKMLKRQAIKRHVQMVKT